MKRIKLLRLSQSFPARLSFLLILMTSAVFIVAFVAYYQSARTQVQNEAVAHAERALQTTILRIESILQEVEVAVNNMAWNVEQHLSDPDSMYDLTDQMLKNNPHIVGSAIAFEPYYFAQKGQRFSPYSCYEGDSIVHKQLGTENYEYHASDWYKRPKELNAEYWSEPYFDEGGGEMIMTTYSKPLYDKSGKMYAIFTADISLEWFTRLVNSVKPYPNAYNIMVGREGTYLIHYRSERILNETIFSATAEMEDRSVADIGHAMINQQSGMAPLQNDDVLSYVFYAPIERTGWSVGIICPQSEVFAGLDKMNKRVVAIFFVGIIFMLICCYHIVRRLTRPLTEFTISAQKIAQGEFNTPLPNIKSKDEMKMLRDSFDLMQRSLTTYIEELKQTTSSKERIESELRIARNIQMGMVPKVFPPFPERNDIDVFAKLIPAKEVGGDLYDFFIEDNRLYFIIGDVSGKGVPASLLMAVTCRLFRTVAAHFQRPTEIVTALNNSLAESNESNMFCTFFIGVLDLKSGRLQYCNAGHNAPIMISPSGETKHIAVEPNLPLGVFEGFSYMDQECKIDKGTAILLYTDGVTEAENAQGALYSEGRLLQQLSQRPNGAPQSIINGVMGDLERYVAKTAQSDDITMLCLRYLSAEPQNKEVEKVSIVIQNRLDELGRVALFAERLSKEQQLKSELEFNLKLALEEAVSNTIKYAYPNQQNQEIRIEAEIGRESLIFTITDSGIPFDPTQVAEVDTTLSAEERPIGGLGIFLIRQIMDEVKYQRCDNRNVLTLQMDLNR